MNQFYLFFCILFCISPYINAQTSPTSTENGMKTFSNENLEQVFCPAIDQIMHDPNTNLWGVGDWVSNEPSYEKNIISFQGAQWVGANLGTVICVYKSDNPTSFPITIQNSTLAPAPTGSNWGKYEKGRKNCPPYTSENPVDINDCPFNFPKKSNKQEDIYEQLDFFKKEKSN